MTKEIGTIRRSQVLSVWGPGAIADFRVPDKTGAPVSGVMVGLDEWNQSDTVRNLSHPQTIKEDRLQSLLTQRYGPVHGFRLPPVGVENSKPFYDILPVVRFPKWLQCPECHRLKPAAQWGEYKTGHPGRYCPDCSRKNDDDRLTWCFPARLIVACLHGHLQEFPWQRWSGCRCSQPDLRVEQRDPGLAGRFIRCGECKRENSLEGVFGKKALEQRGFHCLGQEPWLGTEVTCESAEPPRVLQRGGSNVYWSVPESSLDIPPFSNHTMDIFGKFQGGIEDKLEEDGLEAAITRMRDDRIPSKLGMPEQTLIDAMQDWYNAITGVQSEGLKFPEYRQFQRAAGKKVDAGEFMAQGEDVPLVFQPLLSSVVLASRLREVRAQVSFTRIKPPGGMMSDSQELRGRIRLASLPWFPAVEIRGEGIFLEFDEKALERWESHEAVQARFEKFSSQLQQDPAQEVPEFCTPRFLLLHSFSHALMRTLSLECGYSSSALQERLYVEESPRPMAGVLIYTGSPDAEGTLGGLVRQGRTGRLGNTLIDALSSMGWCSSDPLCITNATSLSAPANGAACHGCMLVPETCCEYPLFNQYLDRAMLVGTPEQPELGFFHELLRAMSR